LKYLCIGTFALSWSSDSRNFFSRIHSWGVHDFARIAYTRIIEKLNIIWKGDTQKKSWKIFHIKHFIQT
jgi:hypothetical protein